MKIRLIKRQLSIVLLLFLVAACGKSRRPGLSDSELFAKQETANSTRQVLLNFDAEAYEVPSGIKYTESRAIDPTNPPVVIDIEMALHQGAEEIQLSSIGKSITYIKATIPKDMRVLDFIIRDDTLLVSCRGQMTQCIVPYTLDGKFLNFIWEITPKGIAKRYHPDIEEEPMPEISPQTGTRPPPPPPPPNLSLWNKGDEIIFNIDFDHTGKKVHYTITRWQDTEHPEYRKHIISLLNGVQQAVTSEKFSDAPHNTYYLPPAGWVHVYKTLDQWFKKSPWSLITFSSNGDTLCRFANYNPVTPVSVSAGSAPERITTYFYNDRLTFRTDYADTIFRMTAPDRIVPVYAINCGKYKLFATEGLRNQIDNKVYIEKISETQRFLFVSINAPTRKKQVLVYDKQQQTLRLHGNEYLSNDIDHGPAFYPEKIMPDGKTMVCSYGSTYFQNNPSDLMDRLFPSMAKNSVVFMIVQ